MFFRWFGNKSGAGFVQLACTSVGSSVVSPKEREALAYLPLRAALGCFFGLVCWEVFGGVCLVCF